MPVKVIPQNYMYMYIAHHHCALFSHKWCKQAYTYTKSRAILQAKLDLALINRAGGLYGRILTEVVCTHNRFSHTDRLSSVNKMFIIWQKQEQFNSFQVTGLY